MALQIKSELTNITELKPTGEDFAWNFKDEIEMFGSRGSANYVSKCKFCRRDNVASIVEGPFAYSESEQFSTLAVLDCRGFEPIEFDPKAGNEVGIADLEYKFVRH
ncbi:hypothetical protein AYI68_g291 [Smittium mucronatum]|uniref:Uncharacterized protein n=1 Tax=Smittium mucronatum TaxID=133383 RepID=A0A1R0H8S8_9FUNG|nr:hypothetical protein AYI68_g291 [Smittium mucronatum]